MPADLATELLDLMDDVVIGEEIRHRTESEEVHSGTVEVSLGVLEIVDDPSIGERLRYMRGIGDLSDCRKLYVDVPPDQRPPGPKRYRIVYRILPDESRPRTVEMISIGLRADLGAYRRAVVRLNRPPGRRGP